MKTEQEIFRALGQEEWDYLYDKLKQENFGWDNLFTYDVIDEYLRFMVLINKYGACSPSYFVDQAWHTHILDTADYERFCEKAFGTMLHHNPNKKRSEEENTSHVDTFKRTLELYEREFGEEPPKHIWGTNGSFKKLDLNTYWVISMFAPVRVKLSFIFKLIKILFR